MSTATGVRGDVARGNDEQFLDLICSDDQFVQAEFDAIIAAEWPSPPPAGPRRDTPGGRHHDRGHHYTEPAGPDGPPLRPVHPGVGAWSRQRSPPTPAPPTGRTRVGRQVMPHVTHHPRGDLSSRPHASPSSA